jgi:acetoacetate decarboxylase
MSALACRIQRASATNTETGQVIPVRFKTRSGEVQEGGYLHAMYLDDSSPIAGGRAIWGGPEEACDTQDHP